MQTNTSLIGNQIEELCLIYLKNNNLIFIEKNFKTKYGEIDLIFKDYQANQLVFIEVRYRKYIFFGEPAETINKIKQQKIITTAHYYLNYKYKHQSIYYRFDIIACSGQMNNIKIDWIKNAFT